MTTLAEQAAKAVMETIGFRYADQHHKWDQVVDAVQVCIDREIEAMGRIASQDAVPPIRKILDYEVRSSWWARNAGYVWSRYIASKYFSWKTKRKYAAYTKSLAIRKELEDRKLL